ncbi:hypothetical protein DF037_06145 [Burkholderia contaminans]|uniref:Uncharacterized protein n=1 Tax=Burkholderia contaminans TaxID=488447 RepID=A0A3N8RGJ7_9BURK|nr:hypothetical protein DF037_06145 [Burkholderia contaminans]
MKARRKYRNAWRAQGRRRRERTFPDPTRVLHRTDTMWRARLMAAVFARLRTDGIRSSVTGCRVVATSAGRGTAVDRRDRRAENEAFAPTTGVTRMRRRVRITDRRVSSILVNWIARPPTQCARLFSWMPRGDFT